VAVSDFEIFWLCVGGVGDKRWAVFEDDTLPCHHIEVAQKGVFCLRMIPFFFFSFFQQTGFGPPFIQRAKVQLNPRNPYQKHPPYAKGTISLDTISA
jgi:hypothetical protein